jgi:DeoR family glycerol-3-phosphate regulon repressor
MNALNPRQQAVVQFARERGYVTVEDLVERLSVTHQTIRRDINQLCDQGILSRFHGGAAFRSSVANLPYEARQGSLAEEKQVIARAVAAEIPDQSSVFIDIGTTAEAVASALLAKTRLRVVTNNINVVSLLAKKEDFDITVCGGTVRNRDLAVVGASATTAISQFQVDFAILGVVAIAEDGSVLDFYADEGPLTQAVIRAGRKVFVVADHSKFGRHAMAKVAHLSQVSAVFTDALPAEAWRQMIADVGTRLVVAG